MNIWISGTLEEIKTAAATELVSAVVTNPTVIAGWTNSEHSLEDVCKEAVRATGLPLYVQLHGPNRNDFLKETETLKKLSNLIIPKIPSTLEGVSAAKTLEAKGCETLITTVVSVNQAYACAAAGVTTICPYLNRLKETGEDALAFIKAVADMFAREKMRTKIMPASVRTAMDVQEALVAGCSGVIIFYPLFIELFEHDVTRSSLVSFQSDWEKIPYSFMHERNNR